VVATKLGAHLRRAGTSFEDAARLENVEGLSAPAIRASALRSRTALGTERIDLLYAHLDDPSTPLRETVEAFARLTDGGVVGVLGVSNQWAWRVEHARARSAGGPARV
jgi:aryl-alcohol dehydrogenase-like predicted oxidoreductase